MSGSNHVGLVCWARCYCQSWELAPNLSCAQRGSVTRAIQGVSAWTRSPSWRSLQWHQDALLIRRVVPGIGMRGSQARRKVDKRMVPLSFPDFAIPYAWSALVFTHVLQITQTSEEPVSSVETCSSQILSVFPFTRAPIRVTHSNTRRVSFKGLGSSLVVLGGQRSTSMTCYVSYIPSTMSSETWDLSHRVPYA